MKQEQKPKYAQNEHVVNTVKMYLIERIRIAGNIESYFQGSSLNGRELGTRTSRKTS